MFEFGEKKKTQPDWGDTTLVTSLTLQKFCRSCNESQLEQLLSSNNAVNIILSKEIIICFAKNGLVLDMTVERG